MKVCTVLGCHKLQQARGMCSMHYYRQAKHGSTDTPPPRVRPDRTLHPCSVEGCERSQRARGYCSLHYRRWKAAGEPGPAERLIAAPGDGCTRPDGYRVLTLHDHPLAAANGQVLEHRVVLHAVIGGGEHPCHWCHRPVSWDLTHPDHPDGLVVDHINGIRADNRPANLVPSCGPCNTRRTAA